MWLGFVCDRLQSSDLAANSGMWMAVSNLNGIHPVYQGPLFDLAPVEVLNIRDLMQGTFMFYFGVDHRMNGSVDNDDLDCDLVEVRME